MLSWPRNIRTQLGPIALHDLKKSITRMRGYYGGLFSPICDSIHYVARRHEIICNRSPLGDRRMIIAARGIDVPAPLNPQLGAGVSSRSSFVVNQTRPIAQLLKPALRNDQNIHRHVDLANRISQPDAFLSCVFASSLVTTSTSRSLYESLHREHKTQTE